MYEVLAPAGDEAAFFAALHAGADAIYLGLRGFSARANAANFTAERLAELIRYAHLFGTRVYVALNTLVKERELASFFRSAEQAWNAGADALILQDLFLGAELKKQCPQLVLHLSTQAGVCNVSGARLAKASGFSRVILARETPLAQIARIARELETEVFVQGALCTCFSGQCYLSSFAGGNSGNRGLCKQPCRKKYTIDRIGFSAPSYALSLADLCVGKRVKELVAAGVTSFKIEGRMRSAAYVGAAVRYYKDIFARKEEALASDLSDLKRAYNRGDYTQGYAFGETKSLHAASVQGHIGERVGTLARLSKDGKSAYVRSAYRPQEGDGFKLLRDGKELGGTSIRGGFRADDGGFWIPSEKNWRIGDGVHLTFDSALAARIAAQKRSISLELSCRVAAGEAPVVTVRGAFGTRAFTADLLAEPAKSSPLTEEDLRLCFSKTGEYPFAVTAVKVQTDGQSFIVRSALNAFRRFVWEGVARALAGEPRPPVSLSAPAALKKTCADVQGQIAVIVDADTRFTDAYSSVAHVIFQPNNYDDDAEIDEFLKKSEYYAWHTWLYFPPFATDGDLLRLAAVAPRFYGVYGEGVYAAWFCKEHDLRFFAGVGCNLFHSRALAGVRALGARQAALSKELSAAELAEVGEGAFVLAGGGIKVMELVHCPFGSDCGRCDRRRRYTLTDEAGRQFPLVRYTLGGVCRFMLYNAAPLSAEGALGRLPMGRLYDLTALPEEVCASILAGETQQPHTLGALRKGIL